MSQINMGELYSSINKKTLRRMELYDSVLKKCHSRILYNSGLQRHYCFYQIPEFIIGTPLYKIEEMRIYIINSLKNNGFQIMYIEPNWLFISWNLPGVKKLANFSLKKEIKNSRIEKLPTTKRYQNKNCRQRVQDPRSNPVLAGNRHFDRGEPFRQGGTPRLVMLNS